MKGPYKVVSVARAYATEHYVCNGDKVRPSFTHNREHAQMDCDELNAAWEAGYKAGAVNEDAAFEALGAMLRIGELFSYEDEALQSGRPTAKEWREARQMMQKAVERLEKARS